MKRWILVIALVVILSALALTVRAWSPPLLAFVGTNTDLIQGLQAGLQILLWLGAAALVLFGYLRGRRAAPGNSHSGTQPTQTIHTQGGAVTGDVHTEGGDFVGRDQVHHGERSVSFHGDASDNMIVNADTVVIADRYWRALPRSFAQQDLRGATVAYLQALLERHRYLNLKGMGVSDRVPVRLPLLDVYVPLKARGELPEDETWPRETALLAGRPLRVDEASEPLVELRKPLLVLDLLRKHDGLVILGDPGAGKTTFLKFLTLCLASGQGTKLGLGERLPVLAPLSAYANALAKADVRLDDFVAQYLHDSGSDLPIPEMLRTALAAGSALVLLDGLDEVQETSLRHTVVERLVDFYAYHRQAGNKFVITSRVVGYRAVRPMADKLSECTLVDFDVSEISSFVERWTIALEREAQGNTGIARADATRERTDLLYAIQRNPDVRRLAANPLLLTILALMKRQGVTLPERRVELYDQYVTALLSTWNRGRGLGRPPSHELDPKQTLRVLAPLALWMHETNPGVGLVKLEELRRRLAGVYARDGVEDPETSAERFLKDVREYAGLLLERGPGEYGFIHLTFEEYLAAVAIALRGQGDSRTIVDTLAEHVGEPAWREVALLTVSYLGLIQQLDRVAGEVVETLVAEQVGPPGEAVVLAGEAVRDAWPGGVPPASKDKVVAALFPTMQDAGIPTSVRRRAGLALGRLGWRLADLDDFVPVHAGEFLYGDEKQKREIPYRYWIGKYPVTNAQYARFFEERGYKRREFWSEAGWKWRLKGERDKPPRWDDRDWSNPIFPVVGVTSFEAEAYGRWLNSRLADFRPGEPPPESYVVRLPTEEEWERAARGRDGRRYPWGDYFDAARCNNGHSGATAVCTYPGGASPVEAWDMVGNVWEWARSPETGGPWLGVRGGSWDEVRVHCGAREGTAPDYFNENLGFRVVVAPSRYTGS